MKKLDAKEKRFLDEYLLHLDPKKAAISAGYAESTADQKSYSWVGNSRSKPHLYAAIQKATMERSKRTQIDADYVLKRIGQIDQMDIADVLNDDGTVKPIVQWPKIWRQFVSVVDIVETKSEGELKSVLKKIKWPDKVKNLELMGRHTSVQAFKDRIELSARPVKKMNREELTKIASSS